VSPLQGFCNLVVTISQGVALGYSVFAFQAKAIRQGVAANVDDDLRDSAIAGRNDRLSKS
jgi:hypothetical protein